MEHEGDGATNCDWSTWDNFHRISKGTGRLRNKRKSGDHPDYVINIGQNTEKNPANLRRLTVIQTSVKTRCNVYRNTICLESLKICKGKRSKMY